MDVIGSEIGQKMRSAIKAKLTELGCYVDDELPDYVMVMVANKRTRAQMEDDLQLFLGDNTELFVNWLHQVLKKLQEVTVTAPLKIVDQEQSKERSTSKERKSKDKKDKSKKTDLKKAKKKEKEKLHRKKEEKKEKKSKKKSKNHDIMRPNIPPLLMNIEKESEPSITDVFAGQILKSHGITVESLKEETNFKDVEEKVVLKEHKRPILPIIDPATISSQPDSDLISVNSETIVDNRDQITSVSSQESAKDEQFKEINDIEAKIQGLKQKLAEQLDSMSEDEDFLNIRTEAEELMNDFAEDVFQEISQQAPVSTPPLKTCKNPSPPKEVAPKPTEVAKPIETLPQIELNLPKRPVRERLGVREEPKKVSDVAERRKEQKPDSPERFTPEPIPEFYTNKSAKNRLGNLSEKNSSDDSSDKSETSSKWVTSKVSVLENRSRSCASVVRVRPRPRVSAPASNLLMRAVADAHKSLITIPPKVDTEPQMVKRGIVLPMRRVGDPKIVIQVPAERTQTDSPDDNISLEMDSDEEKRVISELERDEYVPKSLTMKIKNTDYVPSRRNEGRTASRRDDTLVIETINIHNPTVDKDKNTQFIVTMDGFNPNAFLAKKLQTEGLLEDDDITKKPKEISNIEKDIPKESATKVKQESTSKEKSIVSTTKNKDTKPLETTEKSEEKHKESPKKRLSSESNGQVVINQEDPKDLKEKNENSVKTAEKRKSDPTPTVEVKSPPVKKRRTPIVFDVDKKEKEVVKERERRESASSDNNVVVTTATNSHKYDALPPLSVSERKAVWCRAFPLCRYGAACAFQHPRCKFAAACTRRACAYSHALAAPAPALPGAPAPAISSQVVPAANYKSITAGSLPNMCKYYPSCSNPVCSFFHPKACRYGTACLNKLECNFYHAELPASKWRYPA